MSDQVTPGGVANIAGRETVDHDTESCRRGVATGKPYTWQLPQAEQPPMIALPPETLAEPLRHACEFYSNAVVRTAAFLVVISRNNGYEGRDPSLITDDMQCGTVSDMLGFEIGTLGRVLVDLQQRGLVSCDDKGELRLTDIEALDRLSDGQ